MSSAATIGRLQARSLRAPFSCGLLGLLLTAMAAPAQPLEVDLQLEPGDVIGLEELAILSLKIGSADRLGADPVPSFELENLEIAAGPSKATSLRFINSAATRTLTFTWHLQPQAIGQARIHSGALRVGEAEVELPERRLEVVATAPADRRQRRPRDTFQDPFLPEDPFESPFDNRPRQRVRQSIEPPKIYLTVEAVPADPYVGEQVLYTLYLFTQADVRSVNPEQLPDFKGFWSRVIPQPDQLQPDMLILDGERIGKVVLLQRALFPRRAGRFEIGPVSAKLTAMMPDPGRFASPLPRSREIVRSSRPVTLQVRPLPPPPPGFRGAVGRLRIAAELAPTELEVGEAATLTVTLAGTGHLQGLQPPQLPEMPGIEVFPPQQQSSESVRRQNVSGERNWSFVLMPEKPGRWELPPIVVPYFDPRDELYHTAAAETPSLTVVAATRLAPASGETVELRSVRSAALPTGSGPDASGWHAWLFGVPWGLAVLVFLARRRAPSRHPTDRRRLLERLQQAAAEPRPRQAAAEIEDAWRDFLQDRWGLPPGTPSTRWGVLLIDLGVRPKAADDLVKLADDLHYLRYAPKLSSTTDLRQELVERSRRLVRAVGRDAR